MDDRGATGARVGLGLGVTPAAETGIQAACPQFGLRAPEGLAAWAHGWFQDET
jgi:hypothetical protein